MPRGSQLSEVEVRKVWFYSGKGKSEREISKILQRSKTAIHNVLSKNERYGTQKRSGRKQTLTARDHRRIFKLATKQYQSTRQIAQQISNSMSHVTIWRSLKSNMYAHHQKLHGKPRLMKQHKDARLQWAKNVMSWTSEWKQILFSDEKKFNLDGPDGKNYYWHDLRQESREFYSRQMGGGSVMVWGAFAYAGKCDLQRIHGRMNSNSYQRMLYDSLIPFGPLLGGPKWKFQQDNASCHASKSTKDWFQSEQIDVISWPSRSPDLNPIENLWGYLSRQVYANNKQYNSTSELEVAIMEKCDNIPASILTNLILSMPNRVFQVIQNRGGIISY